MTDLDWHAWLDDWNKELLTRYDPSQYNAFVDPAVTIDVVRSGWLGAPGASEADVGALEERIGTPLPISYRTFLLATNGFLQPGMIVPRLLRATEVDWFRVVEPETIDAWRQGAGEDDDCDVSRDLQTALAVSERETIGTARYLLNPKVVHDGEWEALVFAHWIPGFNRFPSFRALMEEERRMYVDR